MYVRVMDGPYCGATGHIERVPKDHVLVRKRDRGGAILVFVHKDHIHEDRPRKELNVTLWSL